MKISLIHPSRGRANKAYKTYLKWMQNSLLKEDIEHILSIDCDDRDCSLYSELFDKTSIITINKNTCVVEATNHAAQLATGDILVYLSDDFECPKYWDKFIRNAFGEKVNEIALLKVDDCLQKFEVDVLTIPIMTKHLYNKLGYFWNPLYRSMFTDQDLFWTCKNNNWLIFRPDLKFEHKHYSVGKNIKDETYTRSDKNWDQGKAIYHKRKALNFPL